MYSLINLDYLRIKVISKGHIKGKDRDKNGPWIRVPKRVIKIASRRNYLKRLIRHTLRLIDIDLRNKIGLIVVKECDWERLRLDKGYRIIKKIQLYLWRDLNPHP